MNDNSLSDPRTTATASVHLKKQREKSVRCRHPWIFSGAVERVVGDPAPGASVRVLSDAGEFLAYAAWSPSSQICLRIWTFDESAKIDVDFFAERLGRAVDARRALGLLDDPACRLVFGESDGIPGLVVDRYAGYLVCQFLSAGIEVWRHTVVAQLERLLSPKGIYERSDATLRNKEGLPPRQGLLAGDPAPDRLELEIDGLRHIVDIVHGQKTGAYLDQRYNRVRVARLAAGARVLDAYAYTGGFGLQCLRSGAAEATFIDSSALALSVVTAAAELNAVGERCSCVRGKVGDELRALRAAGRTFDLIVLDPPKFVQTAQQVTKGCRAYKDINRSAFELLSPGGILASFSCSSHVDARLFQQVVAQAALEAGRCVRIIERLGQPPDHPVALNFPESEYLKGLVVRA